MGTTVSEWAKAASAATTHSTLLSAQIATRSPYREEHKTHTSDQRARPSMRGDGGGG
jgi:hypothetical protein